MRQSRMWLTGGAIVALSVIGLAGCEGNEALDAGKEGAGGQSDARTLELAWMRYEHPSQAVVTDSTVVQQLQKRKQVKLNVLSVPQSNYDDKKKTLISTNTIPDVMLVKQEDIQNFADSGIFLDLTPYLDHMPHFQKVIQEHPEINKNKMDGKLYGFPLVTKWGMQGGQMPVIRKDVLVQLNAKTPATYEELYQVLKKMKEAYPSSYPYTARAANGLTATENLINPIAFGFGSGYTNPTGAKVYYDPADKQYKFGPASPEFREAIVYLRRLYKEKLLDPDYVTATSQIWQEKLGSGKSMFFIDNIGFAAGFNMALQNEDPNAQYSVLPTLASEQGMRRSMLYSLDHLGESYVVSSKAKQPDRIVSFIDWLYSPEGSALTSFGVENVDYTMTDGEFRISDALLNKFGDKPDRFRSMQSALGTGYLGLALYTDDSPGRSFPSPTEPIVWNEDVLKEWQDGTAFIQQFDPPFNKEERQRLKQLRTQLDSYMTQTMDKFIMSEGALNDWSGFVRQAKAKGADEVVSIYNQALARAGN
ncbi:extracellular solute-binding protein [Paenibacillus mesophilus]|uniref:extracellular solute-binding protein n=1 Tax=Paenibacillus mesophilus TaxID=2582849 RepID=UPI00110D68DE|nr:extracellular solute-binding protein [Paenibacillus mesophilus]TMV49600.1 extracellular solute-binding protein [Paenibacillus mesophilus]